MYRSRLAAPYLHARGHYFLATGRARAALADFRTCGELLTAWSMDTPVLVPWRSDLAQARVRLGEPVAARGLVEEQLRMPGAGGARVRGISLRVLARTHDPERRPALLREAIELLHAAGDVMELMLTVADLGLTYRVLGDARMSRTLERRAMRLAGQCGAEERARRLFGGRDTGARETGARPRGRSLLSEAERRVAELAARGHTNRQISHKLFITVSTVEQHLTRVYRKLKVTSRTDLPSWLKQEDDFEPPRLMTADGMTLPRSADA
jgi:DNA-binding CsgD family transcriptional regulator